jgi:hypothetical protein
VVCILVQWTHVMSGLHSGTVATRYEWSSSHPVSLIPRKEPSVPIYYEAGWASDLTDVLEKCNIPCLCLESNPRLSSPWCHYTEWANPAPLMTNHLISIYIEFRILKADQLIENHFEFSKRITYLKIVKVIFEGFFDGEGFWSLQIKMRSCH